MADAIEMPFGMMFGVGQGNHVFEGDPDPPSKRTVLGVISPIEKHWSAVQTWQNFSVCTVLLLLLPFYGPLDCVRDYPGEPVPER